MSIKLTINKYNINKSYYCSIIKNIKIYESKKYVLN